MFKQWAIMIHIYISLIQLWNHGPRLPEELKKLNKLREQLFPPEVWIVIVYKGHVAQPGSKVRQEERRLLFKFLCTLLSQL